MAKRDINILLVEDNAEDVAFIQSVLARSSSLNFTVSCVTRIQDALDNLDASMPDVILLDLFLPDSNGIDTFHLVRNKTSVVPIIVLTGLDDESSGAYAVQNGAQDFLQKDEALPRILERSIRYAIDRKIIENELRNTAEQLRESIEAKDKLFSLISHDLRSPLHGVVGISNLLVAELKDLKEDEIRQCAETICDKSNKLLELLENLLQWSSLQTGKFQAFPIRIDLWEAVTNSINMLSKNAIDKNISLVNEIPEETHVFIDSNMLNSIVQNLLSNAIKFTSFGGEVIARYTRENGTTSLIVQDNGIGISYKDQDKIFSIKEKFSTPGTAQEVGSGLGLCLCKELIERNNGTIQVDSSPGEGTVITVVIPTASSKNADDRFLIADDDKSVRLLAARLFDQMGYHTDVVENGDKLLDALSANGYSIVITDINMPGKTGIEAVKEAMHRMDGQRRPKFIGFSSDPENRRVCLAAGFDSFFDKPLTPQKLKHIVDKFAY